MIFLIILKLKIQNLLIFNSVNLTDLSQVAKLDSVYIFILQDSCPLQIFTNDRYSPCKIVRKAIQMSNCLPVVRRPGFIHIGHIMVCQQDLSRLSFLIPSISLSVIQQLYKLSAEQFYVWLSNSGTLTIVVTDFIDIRAMFSKSQNFQTSKRDMIPNLNLKTSLPSSFDLQLDYIILFLYWP